MRPASTPWIVFDRDSAVDAAPISFAAKAAMRAGVAFMSNPDLNDAPTAPAVPAAMAQLALPASSAAARLAETNAMFPASVPAQRTNDVEPSSLIVARDVLEEPSAEPQLFVTPKRGGLKLAIAAAAFMGIAAGGTAAFVHSTDAPAPASAQAATPEVEQVVVAPAPAETQAAPAEPAPAPAVAPTEIVGEHATDPKKRWGTLTIKPDAKTKTVWFDGKRMLGAGKRSFMVYCGMHTIAVNDKTDQKDMEVPCNGELVIGK
ncbi:MAG: hypothetical protein KIT84_34765 [Labilithrix sp.]|nr:hypothetical protein [Labilithrix sp.]MCW5816212.1 hypothetical protein [Labilithrix sp.]